MGRDGRPLRGINYDTGVTYGPDGASRATWDVPSVARDLRVIAEELHCEAVTVMGTDLGRLRDAAGMAVEQGLEVWLQPRLIDAPREAVLAHLAEGAGIAEALRAGGAAVTLNVGCELSLFARGILPGRTWRTRMRALAIAWAVVPLWKGRLNAHLAAAARTAREHFGGPLTYSSGTWETVDWAPFDWVGVDAYLDASNRRTYAADVRALHRHGKPVAITEFGCCTFTGADRHGGGGFLIVRDDETIKPGHVRDEQVQADYLAQLLAIHAQEGVDAGFVYAFSEPRMLHREDPRHDLDMASYGVVKVLQAADPENDQREVWEPKAAFAALASHYAETGA
jgi:hypothetical protein